MTRLVEQVTTRLPAEAAFAYVADFSRQAEWDPNTRSSRRVDEGPLGVGARFALEVNVGGRSAPMEYRITEYDPPHRVVLIGEGSGVWSSDDISFTVIPGGTRVDYVAEIKLTASWAWPSRSWAERSRRSRAERPRGCAPRLRPRPRDEHPRPAR